MTRRDFLKDSATAVPAVIAVPHLLATQPPPFDKDWYARSRRFADLSMARVAYVEAGHGPAALFIHGYPLNSYQWRGALERLYPYRRCIAPDLMSLGLTEPHETQVISPHTQAAMLAALLDRLKIDTVDLVANDSGGLTAQIFLSKYPGRVRSLLLTNCDVDTNSPPAGFLPLVDLARKGVLVDRFFLPQLNDKNLARSDKGLGGLAYTYPDRLTDETIELPSTPHQFAATKVSARTVHSGAGGQRSCSDSRPAPPMARPGSYGLGSKGSSLRRAMGRVAGQNSLRLARHPSHRRSKSLLSGRDARRYR